MKTLLASWSDVRHVIADLSKQNRCEIELLGINDYEVLCAAKDFMEKGVTIAVFRDEDYRQRKPCAVFGVYPSDFGQRTWFLATADYFGCGAPAVLHARRYLKNFAQQFGPLVTTTMSPHPKVEKWFRLLGYEKVSEEQGCKIFSYARQ